MWKCFIITLSALTVTTSSFQQDPRISARNGHLSISVDKGKDINLIVSDTGHFKVNDQDILALINSVKDVPKLIDKLTKPNQPSAGNTPITDNIYFGQNLGNISLRLDDLEQDLSNHTSKSKLDFIRIRRRLNILQRLVRNMMTSLTTNECDSTPCENGGTCQDLYKDFSCICPTGWEGSTCEKDVNECAIYAGTDLGCQNGATCTNKLGSYECTCPVGFFGTRCTTKTVDCYSAGQDLCGHGTCMPQAKGYKCFCDQGWTTDGKNPACTVDVNECQSLQLPCSTNPLVQCINIPGSFYCGHCPPGYSGNGYYCNDIDECAVFNGGCSVNPMVQCINTPGSRTCGLCPPGYAGNGVTCSYQGSVCSVNNGGCNPLAQCRDNPRISSSYVECICPRGYAGNGIGPLGCVQSSTPIDPCNPNPCVFGTCSVINVSNDYVCNCRAKYTGRNCDIAKDACASSPCQNGATCVEIFGLSYSCKCPQGFTGNNCQNERQSCGGKLEHLDGVLQFPLEPSEQYNHALSCAWVIQTNSTKVLNITFTRFDLEDSAECQFDWVQIHDGRNSAAHNIGRFCGSQLPKGGNIITTTNSVYIWFRSDTRLAKHGFSLNWTTIDPVCGGKISASSYGTIQSPGYPGNYPLNRDCYWVITTDRRNRLEFHFFTLMIGQDANCTGDYLEFYYESAKTDNRFARYCTTTHPAPLTSPSHNVIIYFHSNNKLTYSGFQISYKVVSGIPSCGGTYTTNTGQITSPVVTFSSLELYHLVCEYKISVANQLRIRLQFITMNLAKFSSLCIEHISVYDGPTKDSPLIGKYCGDTLPAPRISFGNEVLIVYNGKRPNTFSLKYETVCGRKFTEETGVIMSPDYPQFMNTNIECLYEIEQAPGRLITLTVVESIGMFRFFRTFPNIIEVRDGNSKGAPLLVTYNSMSQYPSSITSSHNYLTIVTKSLSLVFNRRKYYMNYTTSDVGCGGIYIEDLGTIKSPNHPGIYPGETNCKWIIQAPPTHVVQLTFLHFKLEQSHSCNYDHLTIYDVNDKLQNDGQIGKFCGGKLPPTLLSTSNSMRIVFESDASHSGEGFLATYVFIAEDNVCGGTYFTSAGVLKSPRYPNPYPVNRDCKWVIHVQPGMQIMLNVTDFQLESYSNCRYDFLEIRNGGTGASPLIGKYCGTTIPAIIYSHANQLFIHFKTDMTRNSKGFLIYWSSASTGCGGLLTSPKGSIISPHYPEPYSKNTECYWKISINSGSVIQIVFADLDLEPHLTCVLDYIEVFDGKDLSAKSLGRYCTTHPPYLRSTANHMMIKFRSDVSFQGRGFQIQYSTVCHNTITGYEGVIESPNFPNRYPQNEDCTWTIGVSKGNKINITFSHFELERSLSYNAEKCNFDYVEFIYTDYETEQEIKKTFCGESIPPPITINSNTTNIHFVSDHLLMGNGFRLEWQLFGCGGILTHPTGSFRSPNYPNHYPASTTCDWVIRAPYGNSIVVNFDKLDIEPTTSCSYDAIQVYNGPDDKSHLMNEICHSNKPITITGTASSMLVRFKSDSSYEGMGFEGTYSFTASKCGGTLIANQGEFTSPNYPKNYDSGSFCEWLIQIEEHHLIEFKFLDVDLAVHGNATYIRVYDGPSSAYPELVYITNKAPNETIRSTYNNLFVVFASSGLSITAKGFKASYQTGCGAILDSETSGVIDYNTIQTFYNDLCTWTIIAPDPTKHVSLTLSHVRGYYCDFEIHLVSIYNGFNKSAPLIDSYCEKLPGTIVSTGSMLHIETNMGFKASYSTLDTACGGSLEGERGYFATPEYPNNYPVDIECEWTVNISQSMTTDLTFESFDLINSDHCNDDFLEIRKGDKHGPLIGVFCGTNIPVNVSALGGIWLYFKSSKPDVGEVAATAKGFKAEYSLQTHTELTESSGTVYSPLYPNYYMKTNFFTWRITVKFGYAIAINVKDLIMSYGYDGYCYAASLLFYDGYNSEAPVLHQLCEMTTTSFQSTSNVMYIESSIDMTRRGIKFAFDWLQVPIVKNVTTPKQSECGTTEPININALRNYTLKSPGYPDGYAHGLNCEWVFSTVPENHLQIDFYTIDLEYRSSCIYDKIEVYSGRNGVDDWSLVETVCLPNDTHRDSIETTNLMKVVFTTDSYLNHTGFSSMVTETCGGNIEKTSGIINIMNSTFQNMFSLECQWNITVRSGRTMQISFVQFDIGTNADSKCNNYLVLRNGQSAASPLLGNGKYCGESTPANLETTSNHLYVKFSSKSRVRGFIMKYNEIAVNCDARITLSTLDNVTTISSPNYPNIPLPHTECKWTISALPGESIQIDFVERFDLTDDYDCEKEYVEIRNGGTVLSPLVGKYCKSMPSTIVTRDNMAFVKFFTDVEEPRNGFKIKLSIAKCGGTIRDSTGEIKSRFFRNRNNYPSKENCTWEVEGPEGHYMIFTFDTLDLSVFSKNCTTDYVEISEHSLMDYDNITSIGKYCKKFEQEIRTTTNKVRVQFITGARNVKAAGFLLKFKSSQEKCGGTLDNDFGVITSPGYPAVYPIRCEWVIKVTKGRRIQVELLDLDFDNSQPSQGLAFSISDNFVAHITFIKQNDKVRYINSTDNTMAVFFWSLFPSNHRGFKLKYSSEEPSVCLADFSLSHGFIYAPANVTYYYCSWKRTESNYTATTLALKISIYSQDKTSSVTSCKFTSSLSVTAMHDHMALGHYCPGKVENVVVRTPYPVTEIVANQASRSALNFTVEYQTYNCGGRIYAQTGTITSPGFPKRSSDNVECAWLIELSADQTIKLNFNVFELGDDCAKSFMIVRNGHLNTSPRLGKYCKNTFPQTLQSQSNSLWIEYHSETNRGKGFNLTYEAISTGCGGIFHDTDKIIRTPNYPDDYPDNAECVWEVRAAPGYHIGLNFLERFHIEKTDTCSNDFVEVWDYKNDNWQSLGRMCGRSRPNYLNSTSTQMKIMFRSNEKTTGAGFKAEWVMNCGGNFTATHTPQYISSPGYPEVYKDNLDCLYTIVAPGKHIVLKFEHFDLEMGSPLCAYDSVTISHSIYGIPRTKAYCGKTKPPIVSAKNEVSVRFQTDLFVRRTGFLFSYQIDECGRDISSPTVISASEFHLDPMSIINRVQTCVWNITAPKDKVVAVKIDKVLTDSSSYCIYNYVEIFDGQNASVDYRLAKLCGNLTQKMSIIKSTKNSMVILYSSYDAGRNPFKATVYFTYGPASGCGGVIQLDDKNKKSVESPNLQGEVDCQWVIQSPDDYYVSIEVQKLPSCEETGLNRTKHLEIRNGASHFAELIVDVCNTSKTIKTFSTAGNFAFIWWYTLNNKGGNDRFKLEFTAVKSVCGLTTLTATDEFKYLTSPNFPNEYPGNIHCLWKINSTLIYRRIQLKFIEFDLGSNSGEQCSGDKIEIIDKSQRRVIDEGLGSQTVLYGGKAGSISKYISGPLGVHQYCGQTATEFDHYSGEGSLVVSFRSTSGQHGKGFKLEYSAVGVCRNYTSSQGRLYSNNVSNCKFTITAPENTTISLYFRRLGLFTRHTDCTDSRLEIYDGANEKATKLMSYCTYMASVQNPIFSTTNVLLINLKNTAFTFAYYDITYTSTTEGRGCGGKIYNYLGIFTSPLYPNNYRDNSDCTWDITVPYGLRVSLKFTVFDIKAACTTDYLQVTTYQDSQENEQVYCQSDELPTFESMNEVKVRYVTSFNNGGTGWVAQFKAYSEDHAVEW